MVAQTLGQQLEAAATTSVSAAAMLEGYVDLPTEHEAGLVWSYFSELQEERQSTGYGPLPFTSRQIMAWARFRRLRLSYWHIRCIKSLDTAFLNAMSMEPGEIYQALSAKPKED